jgi:hypothetical protein
MATKKSKTRHRTPSDARRRERRAANVHPTVNEFVDLASNPIGKPAGMGMVQDGPAFLDWYTAKIAAGAPSRGTFGYWAEQHTAFFESFDKKNEEPTTEEKLSEEAR